MFDDFLAEVRRPGCGNLRASTIVFAWCALVLCACKPKSDFETGPTIPRRAGSIDRSTVARCLSAAASFAKGAVAEHPRPAGGGQPAVLLARDARVIVSARRDTPWQDVVVALDAVRESGSAPALGLAR